MVKDKKAPTESAEQQRKPDYLSEIIELREVVKDSYERTIKMVARLEVLIRQDRVTLIEGYIVRAISKLILILYASDYIELQDVSEIEACLIKIQSYNCLGANFLIPTDGWQPLYEKAVPRAILEASKALQSSELAVDLLYVDELMETIDFNLLHRETLKILRLTYALDPIDTYLYLRSLWLEQLINVGESS